MKAVPAAALGLVLALPCFALAQAPAPASTPPELPHCTPPDRCGLVRTPDGLVPFFIDGVEDHANFVRWLDTNFDQTAKVQIVGKVTRVEWINPSAVIHVIDGDGREWTVWTGAPNGMLRIGLDRTMLAAGIAITMDIHPSKGEVKTAAGTLNAEGVSVTLADGTPHVLAVR